MSRRRHGTCQLPPKRPRPTPALDLEVDERNAVVTPWHITNDGSKEALPVGFVGQKRLKDKSRYSEE
jgi:hypothetical protein